MDLKNTNAKSGNRPIISSDTGYCADENCGVRLVEGMAVIRDKGKAFHGNCYLKLHQKAFDANQGTSLRN